MIPIPPIRCSLHGPPKEMVPLPGRPPNVTAPPRPRRYGFFRLRCWEVLKLSSLKLFPLPKNKGSKRGLCIQNPRFWLNSVDDSENLARADQVVIFFVSFCRG